MKMVTYFNKKDLVSFGNYLLSGARKINTSAQNQNEVTHADVENWKESLSIVIWKTLKEEDIPERKRDAFKLLKPGVDELLKFVDEANLKRKELLDERARLSEEIVRQHIRDLNFDMETKPISTGEYTKRIIEIDAELAK